MAWKTVDYWVPRTKRELVEWFVKNRGYAKGTMSKLPTKQLYAMYHSTRQRY